MSSLKINGPFTLTFNGVSVDMVASATLEDGRLTIHGECPGLVRAELNFHRSIRKVVKKHRMRKK